MLNLEELKEYARNSAKNHRHQSIKRIYRRQFPRIEKDNRLLVEAYKSISEEVKAKDRIIPAAEWLLDNYYIIEEQVKEIQYRFPKRYYKGLSVLESGPLKGLPRMYAIAVEMVSHTDGRLDEETISIFLKEYQAESPLTSAELWAIPFMLKIALIKKIRDIAGHIVESQNQRKEAEYWAQRLLSTLEESIENLKKVITEHDSVVTQLKPSYVQYFLQYLREYGSDAAPIIRWLDGKLALQHSDADEMIQIEHQQQASHQGSMGNAITSLRFLNGMKWEDMFEELSIVERVLAKDPAGVYSKMEFASRDYYRHSVEKLAKAFKVTEYFVAEKAIECGQRAENIQEKDERLNHVGYYLLGNGRWKLAREMGVKKQGFKMSVERWIHQNSTFFYLGSITALVSITMAIFLYFIYKFDNSSSVISLFFSGLLALIPLLSLMVGFLNWVITHIFPPSQLPKLELKEGIPDEYPTMVVIPTLLTSENRVHELIEQMEVFYLANQEENIHFALVGDFKDSKEKETPLDSKIIEAAVNAIRELNKRYGQEREDIFFFFHRERQWSETQKAWMGWERKRGALVELNRMLQGAEDTSYSTKVGDLSILPSIRYVITLDADTQLPRDAAKRLIGAIIHPLNRPILNYESTRVIEGYGLLQPRIGVTVDSASRSFFSLTFSGQTGLDPYTTATSDVYQDIFHEGIFTGKGIYDVEVFNKIVDKAIPESSILSHDLLEGAYIRAGLVTDIELVDGYPSHYIAYAMRLHRWVRGDWQLIPWLFSRVKNIRGETVKNPLSLISKWKILDNLRRSMLPITLFLLLTLGITVLPGSYLQWLGLAILTLVFPLVADLAGSMLSRYQRTSSSGKLRDAFYSTKSVIWQIIISFIFLAYQAFLMTDAIIRTLVRVVFTRRNLLEWVTAADTERRFKGRADDFWFKMWPSTVIGSSLLLVALLIFRPVGIALSILSIIWIIAPWVAYRVSMPKYRRTPALSQEQINRLRMISNKTWRYFDTFVGPEENWLPPDNYQVDPPVGIAHRTSPTNIGLLLVSTLAARDLGYIGTLEMVERLEQTFNTLEHLEKWRGHFYNWYDTLTMNPLKPLYISSVDSGNLAGYLIVLKQGIEEVIRKPLVGKEMVLGLKDYLLLQDNVKVSVNHGLIDMFLADENINLTEWRMLLEDLKEEGDEVEARVLMFKKELDELFPWVEMLLKVPRFLTGEKCTYLETSGHLQKLLKKLNQSLSLTDLLDDYHEILDCLSETMSSLRKEAQRDSRYHDARYWLKQLELALAHSYGTVRKFLSSSDSLSSRIESMFKNMDFRALYDEKKELFSIGYNIEEGELTKSYYDLLASEARQTSFIAIAKGDVPQKHWFKLGRVLTMVDDLRVLLSWSGTMFEYLMPLLIMRNYDYTLLDETYNATVKAQKQYGEQRRVPWGVSESGFYAFDLHLNYQYKAFGVPKLGLKRGLVNDMVVTPYATVMALPIDPMASIKNIELLINEKMDGDYGLYEAIDFTPERLPQKERSMVVRSFMAHHQGMSLLALDNFLNQNIMQKRFHAVPIIRATELLLQERMPKKEIFIKEYEEEVSDIHEMKHQEIRVRRLFSTANTSIPETHLLSNGLYSVMLTNSGSGFSQCQGIAINRWRPEFIEASWGMYFYISNLNSNTFWSATYQPCKFTPEDYQVIFEADRAAFSRRDGNIETRMEVVVSPESNTEVRKIYLLNRSDHSRVLEVTSYFEVVLSALAEDIAHPAFNNLFVETEFLPECNALLVKRRSRGGKQKPVWIVHTLSVEGEKVGGVQYETDRSKFIGRGRDLSNPVAMEPGYPLSNSIGAVLDPIVSLRQRITVGNGETAKLSFVTAIADSREAAIAIAKEYQNPAITTRAFELAWTHSQVEMRYLNMSAREANLYQKMASHILFNSPLRRKQEEYIKKNNKGQSSLWAYGISGDLPIVVVRINSLEHIELAKRMLTAHEYWKLKGLNVDLVFINEYGNSYERPVHDKLRDLIAVSHARDLQDKPGGVFIRQDSNFPEEDKILLLTVARLVLSGDWGPIVAQLKLPPISESLPDKLNVTDSKIDKDSVEILLEEELLFFNKIGGFSKDGKEYVIHLNKDVITPMPWSNIISNPNFGFMITEAGSSYTWYGNSRENKLTPWSNDPIIDPSGEIIFLRDENSGQYWSITSSPIREDQAYIVRHGQGYTRFEHLSNGIKQAQTVFVSLDHPIKLNLITLKNETKATKKMTLTYYNQWVLGVNSQSHSFSIVTDYDDIGVLLAWNKYNEEFPNRIAFMGSNIEASSFTGDRLEFIGSNNSIKTPAAMERLGLSGRIGAGYDPCGALQINIDLEPGEQKDVVFFLGQVENREEIKELVYKYKNITEVEESLQRVKDFWDNILGTIQVNTPDQSMNIMLNRWLIYQTYACRIWARTAFYQAGGAFGFRDQLQDVMAMAYTVPERIREQLLYSAAHQFLEGDVQHWWHPPFRGMRTRITDDLLFLPYVLIDYIDTTDDWEVLGEEINFITDEPLKAEEDSRYAIPKVAEEKATLYEHCIRAIGRASQFGERGLPLIGGGDWNDGMDRVGIEGRGESVWLGWFLYATLKGFIPICSYMKDEERIASYQKIADDLLDSIEKNGWDGGWYRRAYFDDGTPLGSEENTECQIDSISQSWSVISGGGKPSRIKEALRSLENYLVNREEGLIQLLTPPFSKSSLEPGYIKGYLPGVRENGGQYTHAAMWVILAFAKIGDGNKAWELYNLINPINHARTWIELWKYKVEPYVTAADVYSVSPHTGRGGWTWYTGSSSWMYRVGLESILGLKLKGNKFTIEPCIPKDWHEYEMIYNYKKTSYHISVKNPDGVNRGVKAIIIDGKELPDKMVDLVDDGAVHEVQVIMFS